MCPLMFCEFSLIILYFGVGSSAGNETLPRADS